MNQVNRATYPAIGWRELLLTALADAFMAWYNGRDLQALSRIHSSQASFGGAKLPSRLI